MELFDRGFCGVIHVLTSIALLDGSMSYWLDEETIAMTTCMIYLNLLTISTSRDFLTSYSVVQQVLNGQHP